MFKLFGLVSLMSLFVAKIGYKEYYHNECANYEERLRSIGIEQKFLDMLLFAPNTTYKDYYSKLKTLDKNIKDHEQMVFVILNNYSDDKVTQMLLEDDFNEMLRSAANHLKSTSLSINETIFIKDYLC